MVRMSLQLQCHFHQICCLKFYNICQTKNRKYLLNAKEEMVNQDHKILKYTFKLGNLSV